MASEEQQQLQPQPAKCSVHKTDFEKDVVYLYQFTRSPITPSPSPYCLIVETFLRIAGIRYENVDHKLKYKSKKGQVPFIEFNGSEIADSMIIVRQLGALVDKDLDAPLDHRQKAISHAFAAMLNHHTAWAHSWWVGNHPGLYMKGLKLNLQHMLQTRIPTSVLNFIFKMKLKGKKKSSVTQGIGVHKPEEISDFARADFQSLVELLGDKPYFFGDEPTVLDCVAFAHLVQCLYGVPDESYPFRGIVEQKCPRLVEFVERVKGRYWPDWEEMCTTLDLNTHLPKKAEEDNDEDKEKEEEGEGNKKEGGDDEKAERSDEDDEKEKLNKKDDKDQDDNKLSEEGK